MTAQSERLVVLLHGERVAVMERLPGGGSALAFEDSYLAGVPRPTLGQWFLDQDLESRLRHPRLFPFFQNLLPEGWLREVIVRHLGPDADDFAVLRQVGLDLPGSVSILASDDVMLPKRRGETTFSESESRANVAVGGIRWSLAGMQPKLSVSRGERVTVHAEGRGGDWIMKLPTPAYPHLPELECAVMAWARASGILVPETDTIELEEIDALPEDLRTRILEGGTKAFLCARYDRGAGGESVHQEDFAQVRNVPSVPSERKYDRAHGYAALARDLDAIAPEDVEAFISRIVFDVLAGNGDAHLKNWSILYADRINARLSPSYDLVSTIVYPSFAADLALPLEGERDMHAITHSLFRAFAKKIRRDPDQVEQLVRGTAIRVRRAFDERAGDWSLLPKQRAKIEDHLRSMHLGA